LILFFFSGKVLQDSPLFRNDSKNCSDDWPVEPEGHVTMYNNGDKTLIAAVTTSEPLFHPSSLSAWSYIAFLFHFFLPETQSQMYFSLAEHLKPLGDQLGGRIWTLNKELPRAVQGKH